MPDEKSSSYKVGYKWGVAVTKYALKDDVDVPFKDVFTLGLNLMKQSCFNKYEALLCEFNGDKRSDDFEEGMSDGIEKTISRYELREGNI